MNSPRPQMIARERLQSVIDFEQPVGELETEVANIFAEAFNIDRIGANDDFFDLGGDSLMAQSLAISIAKRTGREFRISMLVDYGTPRKIAAQLDNSSAMQTRADQRPPIFMVHGLRGFMLPRPAFLAGLAPGQQLRMFELPGIHGERQPFNSIEEIAAEYVRQLEQYYPEGPVLLGGYCGGCIITLEMAAQLQQKGRRVLRLVLFDPGGIPLNVLHYFRRHLIGGNAASRGWLNDQWKHFRNFLLVGRWTDGSQEQDFSDEKLRAFREHQLKARIWYDRLRGKKEHDSAYNLSTEAQAKLFAAYQHYRPRRFEGPVTIFCSKELQQQFQGADAIWVHLLPNRDVQVLGETHTEVIQAQAATGAKLMQDVFDKALAAR